MRKKWTLTLIYVQPKSNVQKFGRAKSHELIISAAATYKISQSRTHIHLYYFFVLTFYS